MNFGTTSDQVVSCGIYYEQSDRENGALRIIPRSHLAGTLVDHVPGTGDYSIGHWADVDDTDAIDLECPAGTVFLFSANLLHAAPRNESGRSRYSTAWHYVPGPVIEPKFPKGSYLDLYVMKAPDA